MKNIIMGFATVLLYIVVIFTSFDSKMMLEMMNETRFMTQELSATGTLYIDYGAYSGGDIIFNYEEGLKAIDSQIQKFMKLDIDKKPLAKSYWQDDVTYKVYFYDDTRELKVYENGIIVGQEAFNYVDKKHVDELTGYTMIIAKPTVIITINAGRPRFRLKLMQENASSTDILRTGAHVWDDRSVN